MKKLKGILDLYFATGETMRPQFIGNKGLKNDRVYDYDQVYDIQVGDKIEFDMDDFITESVTINEDYYHFLLYLSATYTKEKINVKYTPAKTTKSWGQITKEYKKGLK